jgi:hypothetical protein
MIYSFAMMHAGSRQPAIPPNSSRAALFRDKCASHRCNFWHSSHAPEPVEATSVCYRGTDRADKMQASIRFPSASSGDISMTITTAHIPAIVALIAGILILIMPRLLNLVVAIYLICIGLIGLGVLKWLHI